MLRSALFILPSVLFAFTGCATAPGTPEDRADLEERADEVLQNARNNDPTLERPLSESVGYAIFPTIGKGAVGVGGAYGKGVLYEGGQIVGYCDVTQGSIGLALGGQSYSELIVFGTPEALKKFKENDFQFDAQASAVALKKGAGANAQWHDGVAVFTMNEEGLMFEASVGGQKFTYQPKADVESGSANVDSAHHTGTEPGMDSGSHSGTSTGTRNR